MATTGEGSVGLEVPVAALALRPVEGIDPALGLLEVSGEVEAGPSRPITPAEWDGALALGQLALSHELIGAARTMLELARRHATERVQFGRPIAMFQAVRHRLADSLIAIEAADSLLAGAWEEPAPVLAAMAKGMAGRGARTAAKHCQQVLAGIGFTAEHPFHRFYKRVVVLDQLLGSGQRPDPPIGDRRARHRYPASSLHALTATRPDGLVRRNDREGARRHGRLCLLHILITRFPLSEKHLRDRGGP